MTKQSKPLNDRQERLANRLASRITYMQAKVARYLNRKMNTYSKRQRIWMLMLVFLILLLTNICLIISSFIN